MFLPLQSGENERAKYFMNMRCSTDEENNTRIYHRKHILNEEEIYIIPSRYLYYQHKQENNNYHSQDHNAVHFPIFLLVALCFLKLLKALFHLDLGVLHVLVYSVDYLALERQKYLG